MADFDAAAEARAVKDAQTAQVLADLANRPTRHIEAMNLPDVASHDGGEQGL